jgi:hypothetical protein
MTQINFDASRLQGVDLSQVPNQKTVLQKTTRTPQNAISAGITQASISASATVSTVGQWAAIPQDFGSGSLKASMVLPTSTSGSVAAAASKGTSVGITIGLTAVAVFGAIVDGGIYAQESPREFGLLGSMGPAFSTSAGIGLPIDFFMVNGPISLLDGWGLMIAVDVGVSKTLFVGLGMLVSLPSWDIIGFVGEIGGGASIGPPVCLNVSVTFGGHVRLL